MSSQNAVIFGCEGLRLSGAEKSFFGDAKPWGFILFARNLDTPNQIRTLCADLRECVGRDAPILIDQEGGRVQRLRAPQWREWLPPLDQMAAIANPADQRRAMALRYRMIAHELRDLGIDVNCAPMLDVPTPDAHDIIMNRCYGDNPDTVAEMGRAVSEGLLAGGVLPIIKHIPGHGRANLDSHHDLPHVDASADDLRNIDFKPFRHLSDLPMAMTAHIVYTAMDAQNCATLSPIMIDAIRNDMGFDGLLMSDDLSMKALSGTFAQRTAGAINAGCDVILHCNGQHGEMDQIMTEVPALSGKPLARANAALAMRHAPEPFDLAMAEESFSALL
ncbi:beta-N-acetylhexosaminidase [Paramylibacter ulvae]|uniref:beta-N-acetylhexosaminidase n=1 Tax=Paramylibacter ulvae TaxID=1651968 RepID=UPI001E2B1ED4|nr:beta-N-acetylhexosaminidase [Amylibacter ulvae]